MSDIKELRRLAEEATPGPWVTRENPQSVSIRRGYKPFNLGAIAKVECMPCGKKDNDAEYIAAANPATILSLLDRIEQLEKNQVPEGWQAVPVEPTKEMIEAADQECADYGKLNVPVYKAMLSAAPKP